MVSPADALIRSINMDELYRRRKVRGVDLNDWLPTLEQWSTVTEDRPLAIELLEEIMTTVEALVQYDPMEPRPYWYIQAARIHREDGRPDLEADVLYRWLAAWPEDRREKSPTRNNMANRAADAQARTLTARQ